MLQPRLARRVEREPLPTSPRWPHRRLLLVSECVVAVAGLGGSVMLLDGRNAPPLSAIAPLGLTSWAVPAVWLSATVPVPATVAAVLIWRRSPRAPQAVVLAGATMALEVLVQIPFIGPHPFQAVFGGTAVVLSLLARHTRRAGWGSEAAN